MKHFEIQEVDSSLTALFDEVTETQSEIVITRNGVPVARIIPCDIKPKHTANYPLRGMPINIAEDFDEPMSEFWEMLGK